MNLLTYLSIYLSIYLSNYLSIYLSICKLENAAILQHFLKFWAWQRRKRNNSARLPLCFWTWQHLFELDNIKNKTILRDFLNFRSWQSQKEKNPRDFLQKWKVECRADGLVPMRFLIFPLHLSNVLHLPRKSDARSYEVLHLSRKIIFPQLKIWCSKMQPLSGNQLLPALMNMSLVLRLHQKCIFADPLQMSHACHRFLQMLQHPHVLLTFEYPFLFPFVEWCVRLPQGLVSLCLPLYPFLFPFVGSCVRLPEGPVSPRLPSCFHLLDGASAFQTFLSPLVSLIVSLCWMRPPSPGLVSPCLPSWIHVLDGASAFPGSCFPFSPMVSLLVSLCWIVCAPSQLVSQLVFQIFSLIASLCWMVCPPSRHSCLPWSPFLFPFVGWRARLPQALSPLVSLLVSMCWMVRPPSRGLVSPCLPS